MYCSNCGAAVVGKFCSCCGKRVAGELEAFRRYERKTIKDFTNEAGSNHHLATACWYVCERKYGKDMLHVFGGVWTVAPDAYEKLGLVEAKAKALFLRLLILDDF